VKRLGNEGLLVMGLTQIKSHFYSHPMFVWRLTTKVSCAQQAFSLETLVKKGRDRPLPDLPLPKLNRKNKIRNFKIERREKNEKPYKYFFLVRFFHLAIFAKGLAEANPDKTVRLYLITKVITNETSSGWTPGKSKIKLAEEKSYETPEPMPWHNLSAVAGRVTSRFPGAEQSY
jgi:hypothetical protein